MSLLVTGSIGIDTVETPYGRAEEVLGGSAVYFAFAAGLFGPVRLVGAAGEDFPPEYLEILKERPIDLRGLEIRSGSRTFRWHGRYVGDMNEALTIRTELNVLAEHPPAVPEEFRDSRIVFLANTHPVLQRELLAQLSGPEMVVCDTMNHWIANEPDELVKTLARVHGVVLNDGEARMLAGCDSLLRAGRAILKMGPRFVVIKKGEHGCVLLCGDDVCCLPAWPTEQVVDPTGAGDSFAGGMMGYLAQTRNYTTAGLKAAVVRGTVAATFAIEDFSLNGLRRATKEAFDRRVEDYRSMLTVA